MLPDLVENLRSLVASQYAEADRAVCGRGNYSSHQKRRLTIADWKALIESQRERPACCLLLDERGDVYSMNT